MAGIMGNRQSLSSQQMDTEKMISALSWFVMATLALAIARQLSEQKQLVEFPSSAGGLSYNRPGWNKPLLERFENQEPDYYGSVKGVDDKVEVSSGNPADASITNMHQPYSLLGDVLPVKRTDGTLTAKTCYQKDFLAQSNKTGNYLQRTNNFVHAEPDNCSAPLTEMVDSFYLPK
jgi:hypothetical protein